MLKDIVIIHHGNCPDGFGGAWAAWKKFGDRADYIGVQHHTPPPEDLGQREVYIIDFAYPREETKQIQSKAKSLTIIDHHISSKEVIESVPDHLYSVEHSGATLAWQYFFPKTEPPLLLKYLEDLDLWRFNLPRSQDFSYFISTIPYRFSEWENIIKNFEDAAKREKFLNEGRIVREREEKVIGELVKTASEATLEGHRALVVHIPGEWAINARTLVSHIGNAIVEKGYDIGIVWSYMNGDVKVSLRSQKDGEISVAQIAEKHGGGGHSSSAAFKLTAGEEFPWRPKTK